MGKLFLGASILTLLVSTPAISQGQLALFVDCDRCDEDYLRREIPYVDYVRDRTLSDVHLLVSTQRTGSGREYDLVFLGRNEFQGVTDTLKYSSSGTDTDDEERRGLARYVALGLVRYIARTSSASQLSVEYQVSSDSSSSDPERDKWDHWVFRVGSNGFYSGEESTNSFRISGNVSASRVTDEWKLRLSTFGSYRERNFEVDDSTITSIFRNGDARALAVNSISDRWSVGGFMSAQTSSFNNTRVAFNISPAVEYSIFPYGESSHRELRFTYYLGLEGRTYEELTIFEQTSEVLLSHEFEVILELEQPWGEAEASFEASNFLTDFKESKLDLYNIELGGYVEVRVVRGLSVFGSGSISRVNDQISLPLAEASDEDILLGNVRLPTSFEYDVSVGVSYTFGSIFNNIVNPRFGR